VTPKKRELINLHEILRGRRYDNGVICTYSYDSLFFEEYCLEKFNCLVDNGNLTVITDEGIYEQAILGPASEKPKQANIRYLLHPISVPGAFHAKLFLFASRDRGRLIIGSANFTSPGITSNAEMVKYYDFEVNKDEFFLPIFQEAYAFLVELNNRYASTTLSSNLRALSRDAPWLTSEPRAPALTYLRLLHNLDTPLWDQLVSHTTAPIDAIFILSRYFDSTPQVLTKLQADLSPKRIELFTQNGITTLSPDWLRHPLSRDGIVRVFLCTYGGEEHLSPLHAKAIALETANECIFAFGSANFTTPAMFLAASRGNIETVMEIKALPGQINLRDLLDPDGSAVHLTDEHQLQSAAGQNSFPTAGKYSIRLLEATLIEQKILLSMDELEDKEYQNLAAVLSFDDNSRRSLALLKEGSSYCASCSGELVQRLGESSTVVQVEASRPDGTTAKSNPLLIINLIDIHSGQNLKRERNIKEAEENAEQFLAVLRELINSDEEHDLIVFLSYCDIPVIEASKPIFKRAARPAWDGGAGMRHLGERNLTLFTTVHEAAVSFVDHHYGKLQRHVTYGSINGIPNFMHIFLAIGSIIRSQLDRLLRGFEATLQPLSTHDWFVYRRYVDIYFEKFQDVLDCLSNEYLPKMSRDYGTNEVVKRLDPDFALLNEICHDILMFRPRIEALRSSTIKVMTPSGGAVTPRYFECVLNEARWPAVAHNIETMLATVGKIMNSHSEGVG